jgi:Flp pilus assembly protein TadG
MIRFLRKLWKDRGGNVLIVLGAALPLIVGAGGLATDTVQWTLAKRELQRSADSGALAGVFGELAGQTVKTGTCSSADTPPVYYDVFNSSHSNTTGRVGTTSCSVTTAGWGTASNESVQVTLSTQQTLPFSSLFLKTAPTITATATAAYVLYGSYCMVSLDNNVETGIQFSGNPKVNLGCGMKTNAKGTAAIDCGGNATITATPVAAVGQITPCNNFGAGTTFQSYSPPQTDPFAGINAPSVPSPCNKDVFPNGTKTTSVSVTGSTTGWANNTPTTVCYTDFTVGTGQTFTGSDLLVIINSTKNNSGNLNIQGSVTCTRCVFVLTSNSSSNPPPIGTVSMNASATFNVSAPTTGTYANIAIYQDRRAATCNNFCDNINGNSSSLLQGAVYLPNQNVQINGNNGMNTNCLQVVAWQIQFNGDAGVSNSCPDGTTGNTFKGYMVRLVA